jgi:hypothetical protein
MKKKRRNCIIAMEKRENPLAGYDNILKIQYKTYQFHCHAPSPGDASHTIATNHKKVETQLSKRAPKMLHHTQSNPSHRQDKNAKNNMKTQ